MARTVFFVGPSGTGKSTLSQKIAREYSGHEYASIDVGNIKADNNKKKIKKAQKTIQQYENKDSSETHLLDVGAFFQHYIPIDFWQERQNCLILIWNDADFCYENYAKRKGKPRKPRDKWEKNEFQNENRKNLYALAPYRVETDKSEDASAQECVDAINKIF